MKKQGFTLIELLVVITIVGILASVILVALNVVRGKGANASVKQNLGSVRSQAELSTNTSGDYSSVCDNTTVTTQLTAVGITNGGGAALVQCNDTISGWAAAAKLKVDEDGNNSWCVDNSGTSKSINITVVPWAFTNTFCP